MKYIVNVEGAVLRDGKYLMIIRGPEESHAPGILATVGGKAEETGTHQEVFETALKREVREETGIEIRPETIYLGSSVFTTDDGQLCADVMFLCRHESGEAAIRSPGEVADLRWMTRDEILAAPSCPPWTIRTIELAERARRKAGW